MKTHHLFFMAGIVSVVILAICGYIVDNHISHNSGLVYTLIFVSSSSLLFSAVGFSMTAPIKNSNK